MILHGHLLASERTINRIVFSLALADDEDGQDVFRWKSANHHDLVAFARIESEFEVTPKWRIPQDIHQIKKRDLIFLFSSSRQILELDLFCVNIGEDFAFVGLLDLHDLHLFEVVFGLRAYQES